jgi:hypothetical protein
MRCKMSKVWSGATAPRQTRSILQAAESSHCSGAGLRPRLERSHPCTTISAKEPLRLRRRVAIGDCFVRAILPHSRSPRRRMRYNTPSGAVAGDARQATSHGLWLTSSCLAMHHANRFMPGGSSKPNATGESSGLTWWWRWSCRVSSFEPAVLSQYYCLDSNSRPASVIPRKPTNS